MEEKFIGWSKSNGIVNKLKLNIKESREESMFDAMIQAEVSKLTQEELDYLEQQYIKDQASLRKEEMEGFWPAIIINAIFWGVFIITIIKL